MFIGNNDLIITQRYKGESHRGVDLRTWDFNKKELMGIVTPERLFVMRYGLDGYANYFLVGRGLNSDAILKFIHIDNKFFNVGDVLMKFEKIGFSKIGGNSTAHHLHFETWLSEEEHINPVNYLHDMRIKYKYV